MVLSKWNLCDDMKNYILSEYSKLRKNEYKTT